MGGIPAEDSLYEIAEDLLDCGRGSCAPRAFFGGMTADDWWQRDYLHADHHLRQLGR
jgi:hypothetical protein